MGASVGAEQGKSVNVELNIVPFIDLMSCLTAFLLVAAVWVNIAQVPATPTGRNRDGGEAPETPKLSLLVQADQLWLGVSRVNDVTRIARVDGEHDWEALAVELARQRAPGAFFADDSHLELAAESTTGAVVPYRDVVHAMDIAIAAGFKNVQLTDARGLSARPE